MSKRNLTMAASLIALAVSFLALVATSQPKQVSCRDGTAPDFWSPRSGQSTVLFQGKIWVLGGEACSAGMTVSEGSHHLNDVWNSEDGITWNMVTPNAPWGPRSGHTSVVFDSKIWLMGGSVYLEEFNDVWYSEDGLSWFLATQNPGWKPRSGHASVVFDGRIWVIGGADYWEAFDDVWFSGDGAIWQLATENTPWGGRDGHSSVVFDGRIWVMGGYQETEPGVGAPSNNVWSTADGTTWEEITPEASWSKRRDHVGVSYEGAMWILGGHEPYYEIFEDVWRTTDGFNWEPTSAAIFGGEPRKGMSGVAIPGAIWVLGGEAAGGATGIDSVLYNEVFHSATGEQWEKFAP